MSEESGTNICVFGARFPPTAGGRLFGPIRIYAAAVAQRRRQINCENDLKKGIIGKANSKSKGVVNLGDGIIRKL